MSAATRWGRILFQLIALLVVVWGVTLSVRRSAEQLGNQREELQARADELRQQAAASSDPGVADDLIAEAERATASVRRFWRASWPHLGLAGLSYALGMLPACWFWRRCLAALGQPTPALDVAWAYFYGNLGKYFPGKAMVIVLRLAALEKHGIQKTATSITIFMETLTLMAVGGAVAAVCTLLLNIDWRLSFLSVGLLLVTWCPTAPPVVRFLLPRLQKGMTPETLRSWSDRITWRLMLQGWVGLLLTWMAYGLSLMLVLKGLPVSEGQTIAASQLWLSACGACALAVVLGFVSLIPGGAGVREVVLSMILTPVVGPVAALCGALWMRVVWLITELTVVGVLAVAKLIHGRRPIAVAETELGN